MSEDRAVYIAFMECVKVILRTKVPTPPSHAFAVVKKNKPDVINSLNWSRIKKTRHGLCPKVNELLQLESVNPNGRIKAFYDQDGKVIAYERRK